MSSWVFAVLVGVALAGALYGLREPLSPRVVLPLALLRAAALTLLVALVLDAPSGPARAASPVVALDVSASWLRGGDSSAWRAAVARARKVGGDSVVLFGDSVRAAAAPAAPMDGATRLTPVAERALASGRPVVVVTDGELDDTAAVRSLPAGSRLEIIARKGGADGAVVALEAPRALVAGDTIELRVTVRAGAVATGAARLALRLDDRSVAEVPVDALPATAERVVTVRLSPAAAQGTHLLRAVLQTPGDVERRNDTLGVAVEVAQAAGAVLASSSPDYDARFLIPVLRGAVSLPARAYFRVAPGAWRAEGSLAAVSETEVRAAVRDAPLAILHGDTAMFGPPSAAATGALALLTPPGDSVGEWYATAAPPSTISASLSGLPWDSLPPLGVAPSARRTAADGETWEALEAGRPREVTRRAVVVGSTRPRRTVVVPTAGLWRWRFRGGASADAYATLWGSIFDWLTAERPDRRAAFPAGGVLRAGERIRWTRSGSSAGGATDSMVVATIRARGAAGRGDTLRLRFGTGTQADAEPLAAGVYDVELQGGVAVLVVNAARELLPRAPTARAGAVGAAALGGSRPSLRDRGWPYLVLLGALCLEWLLRRKLGLR